MAYKKLLLTLFISFITMYAVMFLNLDDANHIYLSLTRAYMALLMVTPMAVTMLLMMGSMYPNKKLNRIAVIASIAVFALALFCLREQKPIGDIQYMKAMIPHHSSAILTSKNANISDPEVRNLADQIIRSQEEEIAQMKSILERMKD